VALLQTLDRGVEDVACVADCPRSPTIEISAITAGNTARIP
jgi:hypothetical protein